MATILILGAGVMGTALAVPASDNGHTVLLAGTPLDTVPVARMKSRGIHPKLDAQLAGTVTILADEELGPEHAEAADLVVVGVSSPGIAWAVDRLNRLLRTKKPVAFVTKGLDREGERIATYAETVPAQIANMETFIGIGGPCIARELANRYPTSSIYASHDRTAAAFAADLMRTPYYRLTPGVDVTGVEACAALKNFFAIGVSAMQTRYPDRLRADGQSKNPAAAAFNQAAQEMALLCERIGGSRNTAFDLAGIGDLHVTVGGGRNSRLGHGLGLGRTVSEVMTGELGGETVEGIDTARIVGSLLRQIDDAATLLPLASAITTAILDGGTLAFDFDRI
ncbi:glycerol-3-phosphate dehydrogenase [Mesorhizobium plurifarium]|uniref:2-dehydropantoate 2-reductase N-terminal domain-containing protein n=1 Tax=Sinorhizobium arboris TaxID=76745 RepID=UPI00040CA64B|nr:2-dehydropantoate 2-reductase N-terminal domain-containing protein [Sinorhizobium arboris]PST18657.1 glycerol-3-phosphate dehydrogenase [Mesorhizobium plurifarium]